jgi:hypothetical protein
LAIVFTILIAVIVVVGLITIIMSIKNWHWAQMVLLLSIFFVAILNMVLGMEVYRIHRNFGRPIPGLEKKIAEVEEQIDAIQMGTRDQALANKIFASQPNGLPFDWEAEGGMPSIDVWRQRLQDQARERGRVWNGVKPARVDVKAGQVTVGIPAPKPHGLQKDTIVYAFEQLPPGAVLPPGQKGQYLGEFRVTDTPEGGAVLQSVQGLDQRTATRLDTSARSGRLWKLYEKMPLDSHELFAGLTPEQLKQMLPPSSVNEYLRQGTPATPNDDDNHRAGFDEKGLRVGPEDKAKAVKWLFDRPLRDYAYLFTEFAREKAQMLAQIAGLKEDIARLEVAKQNAEKLQAHRKQEITALTGDLKMMQRDRTTIEQLLGTVKGQLANATRERGELLQKTAASAQKLMTTQLAQLRAINEATAPAAALPPTGAANAAAVRQP